MMLHTRFISISIICLHFCFCHNTVAPSKLKENYEQTILAKDSQLAESQTTISKLEEDLKDYVVIEWMQNVFDTTE